MAGRQLVRMLAVAAVLMPAGACASGPEDTGKAQVATLASTGSSPASSPSAAPQRPRERLDSSQEEIEAMIERYNDCVREQGAKPKPDWGSSRPSQQLLDKLEKADKICEPLYWPLPPWEKDPANPEAKDFARDVVRCLKGKGVRLVEVGENGIDIAFGGPRNDRQSITRGLDLMPECEREVAARRK